MTSFDEYDVVAKEVWSSRIDVYWGSQVSTYIWWVRRWAPTAPNTSYATS